MYFSLSLLLLFYYYYCYLLLIFFFGSCICDDSWYGVPLFSHVLWNCSMEYSMKLLIIIIRILMPCVLSTELTNVVLKHQSLLGNCFSVNFLLQREFFFLLFFVLITFMLYNRIHLKCISLECAFFITSWLVVLFPKEKERKLFYL